MRKSKPKKRILLPDPKYHDTSVTQFVNNLMLQGKKSIAYSIFYDAIDMVGENLSSSRLPCLLHRHCRLEDERF